MSNQVFTSQAINTVGIAKFLFMFLLLVLILLGKITDTNLLVIAVGIILCL